MAKNRVIYCRECGRKTIHTFIDREAIGSGLGPIRLLLAIGTLGVSEITTKSNWECSKCSNIRTIHHQ